MIEVIYGEWLLEYLMGNTRYWAFDPKKGDRKCVAE